MPNERRLYIVAYSPSHHTASSIKNEGLLCVWNSESPSFPEKFYFIYHSFKINSNCFYRVLVCDAPITSFVILRSNSNVVIAGTSLGFLVLWDLKQEISTKVVVMLEKSDQKLSTTLRYPTYSTDWLLEENHFGQIQQVLSIGYNTAGENNFETDQVVSMDIYGSFRFWNITHYTKEFASSIPNTY